MVVLTKPGGLDKDRAPRIARWYSLRPVRRIAGIQALLWAFLLGLACHGLAQETADYFRTRCAVCHTIGGGRLTGPDLKNVLQQAAANGKDREWLIRFIQDPSAMLQSGDPYALKLQRETPGNAVMPSQPDMTRALAGALLDLIEAESKLERSPFAGSPISLAPFTPEDVQVGRELFRGTRALASGGPPCLSCHSVSGIGPLGGGRLGPDLTLVNERLGGPKGLSTWLLAPPTPTMQSIFKSQPLQPEEIHAVAAWLNQSAQEGAPADMRGPLTFFLLGLGGAAGGLVLFDGLWHQRFRAVRYPLVHNLSEQGDE
jgi:mono/diheme cytochrome c family protein